ncbi:Ig-like domain-containing protein [Smaragdicoccus niigatensis]|uniref:Ig-like domain-containing protein n=1 Tax=Smaragdicoccus niigatensis TaxID=359359 RepID=UPI000376CECB|nr:Ig-like domain-containing protein [Smaragdicoccus niigatensis]
MAQPPWRSARELLRSSTASALVVALVAGTVIFLALRSEGFPATDVKLNAGSVWVTDQSRGLAGTLNPQIAELTGAVKAKGAAFDVVQEGDNAFLVTDNSLSRLDGAMMQTADPVTLVAGSSVSLGGGVLASIDAAKGQLRISRAAAPEGIASGATPTAELGPGSVVTVGPDGSVRAFSTKSHELISWTVDESGSVQEGDHSSLDGVEAGDRLQIAAVGSETALLDATKGRVLTASHAFDTGNADPANIALQLSSDDDKIVYATDTHLVEQPLDGSKAEVREVEGAGSHPARPAVVSGCVHAAWTTGTYVRQCGEDFQNMGPATAALTSTDPPTFRVNRQLVVLNGIAGELWVPKDNLKLVDNWQDVIPPDMQTDEHDEQSLRRSDAWTTPERQNQNRPPVAQDDQFGARPGRTTMLTVLDNDSDPDGDVLTVRPLSPDPSVGVARGGSALQITLPADATGERTFDYEVSDGLGGTATAHATVAVRTPDQNDPPTQKRIPELVVAAGKTIRYNALNEWKDPDGDSVIGVGAASDGDDVQLLANGLFSFTDTSNNPGLRQVRVTMSDGRKTTTGVINVNVKPADQVLPVPNADHVTVAVGKVATLRPLANDSDPGEGQLRLAKVGEVPDLSLTPDFSTGDVKVAGSHPGIFYTSYTVTDGPNTAQGLIRVDVIEPQDESLPPAAANDVALLSAGHQTLVDVLANDSDPNERVLVVQSIQIPPNSGISVAVVDHRVLRISDSSGFSDPITVNYTVSNGSASAVGAVDVVPLAPAVNPRPPVAQADTVNVRVKDVATVDVLANDNHPDGDEFHLQPKLAEEMPGTGGFLFVSNDQIRVRAGETPGTYNAVYTIVDSRGQTSSAQVTVNVLARDDASNSAPKPPTVTARALSGSTVRIPIDTNGIDPDGDSVTLTGTSGAPQKGVIAKVGNGWVDYTALADSTGTDGFDYTVEDRLGRPATGHVDIGIAPRNAQNQLPNAVDDRVSARPDRAVTIPVLANDTDPDGDRIKLAAEPLGGEPGAKDLAAEVHGSNINVTTPSKPGTYTFTYNIIDDRGARGRASVAVTVDPNAPLAAPVAIDDFVSIADLVDNGKLRDTVDVKLLENDADPDGSVAKLDVTSVDGLVKDISDGVAEVTVADDPQVLLYTDTDSDGLKSSAFIHVPGKTSVGPTLKSRQPVEIPNNSTKTFDLDDLVVVRSGHSPRLTTEQKVTALHSDGASLVSSATALSFHCAPKYVGEAGLTFEVTDGTGPEDASGKVSTLTVPIKCMATENQQPTFTGTTVELSQGDPATVDLAALAKDADGDNVTFDVGAVPSGISANLNGSELVLTANGAQIGTELSVPVTATDGKTDPVPGNVVVRVSSSNRPRPQANPDEVTDGKAGSTSNVDVLANDFNPFPDKSLTVLSASVASGNGTANVNGSQVAVTPAAGFIGNMTVNYRIADATGDPARQATGTITVTVRDKPATPGTPRVQSVQSQTIVLTWSAPADNGAPITSYKVSGSGGFSQDCPQTTCSLTGLTNGQAYTFTVTAVNAVGESAPSASSASATPDGKPDTPAAPTVTAGDASVQVNWSPPNNTGTPITSYTLQISPAPPSGGSQKTGLTGTSYNWTGLENGVPYTFQVQAKNGAPDPSNWSPSSAAATPAGKPATPAAPTAARSTSVVNGGTIDVSWAAPNSNGADITSYTVTASPGGSSQQVSATSATFTSLNKSTAYTFTVTATNKVGTSSPSSPSNSVTPFGLPDAVTSVSATAGDGQVTLSYSAPNDNGSPITSYEVSMNGGAYSAFSGTSSGGTVSGLTNGTSYTFKVRGVNAAGPGPDGGTSSAVTPFGPPKAPAISGSAAGTAVNFTWDSDSSHMQNGRPISSVTVTFDSTGVANNGSYTGGSGYSQSHSLKIHVCDDQNTCVDSTGQATSGPMPTLTTTDQSCPEPSMSSGPTHTTVGGSCPSGYMNKGYSMQVDCYYGGGSPHFGVTRWFHMATGSWAGQWVAGDYSTLGTSVPSGMPAC